MKLTIRNYNKLVGKEPLDISDWTIYDVHESDDYYTFVCKNLADKNPIYGHMVNIRLRRNGIKEGEWKYRFWHTYGQSYHQVSADWFADMDNARKAIGMEIKKL
jgi:hypothetical protein